MDDPSKSSDHTRYEIRSPGNLASGVTASKEGGGKSARRTMQPRLIDHNQAKSYPVWHRYPSARAEKVLVELLGTEDFADGPPISD